MRTVNLARDETVFMPRRTATERRIARRRENRSWRRDEGL
jgi:hypothetical protein